ncbi:hypothetical protein HHI36_001089 [Cryptolaemus montrouzieri]|uniref:PiggyBac transposable element-derived protein domain-containing protein n=1 Tax=Cryptolaemus montrouzieri TaxID=559131 RepID=A0ABD2P6H5_9CUCU
MSKIPKMNVDENYKDYDISFERGLNLNDILALLKEGNSDDDSNQTSHVDVVLMSPSNTNGEVTDEDSGDEDQVRPSNLPGWQLSAPAEIYSDNRNRDADFDSEDEISSTELAKKMKGRTKEKKNYHWTNGDLVLQPMEWPSSIGVEDISPISLFAKFFPDSLINLIVTGSNR